MPSTLAFIFSFVSSSIVAAKEREAPTAWIPFRRCAEPFPAEESADGPRLHQGEPDAPGDLRRGRSGVSKGHRDSSLERSDANRTGRSWPY